MKEKSTETGVESRPAWESLEAFARQGVQRLLQQVLEEEVEAVLGRARYARRDGVDASPGYRNGHGKPRRLSAMAGTITIRRPRVRGLAPRFESRLLPLFKRRTEEVGRLLPDCTCTDWRRGTSTWRCAGCWAKRRRCRPRPSRG